MRAQFATATLLVCITSANAGVVIQSESYRIWGGVSSENTNPPPISVVDSYDTTAASTVSDRVDGLYGNYAESIAGRTGMDFFAEAESVELSSGNAGGAASARVNVTFVSTEAALDLDMQGAITWIRDEGGHGFSSASVQVKDLTSGATLLDFAPTIPPTTPTASAAPWEASVTLPVDPTHTLELIILSNGYGYEPFPLGVAATTVTMAVVPDPASAWGVLILLGCTGLIRRE